MDRQEFEDRNRPERETVSINIMQTSMNLGTLLGLCTIATYIFFLIILKFPSMVLVLGPAFAGVPVAAFFLVRNFRERNSRNFFPFPLAWMITLLSFLCATVLSGMVTYLYLRFIDGGAIQTALAAMFQQVFADLSALEGMPQESLQQFQQYSEWFSGLTPLTFTKNIIRSQLLWGNIFSLVIGLATARRPKIGTF